jgi:hypothetical protein
VILLVSMHGVRALPVTDNIKAAEPRDWLSRPVDLTAAPGARCADAADVPSPTRAGIP